MSQMPTQMPSSELPFGQWLAAYNAQQGNQNAAAQQSWFEQYLNAPTSGYSNNPMARPPLPAFGPMSPGVNGPFVGRGGISRGQSEFLFSALSRDQELAEAQRQAILGEAGTFREVSRGSARDVREMAGTTAGNLRNLSQELGVQAGPGGNIARGVEEAGLAVREFERTAPEEIGAFTQAIQRKTRDELSAIESGQLPDGTVMTPQMQIAARSELSSRVQAETAPVVAQMRTRQQETLANLRMGVSSAALTAAGTQAEFGKIRAGLESQAADILNAGEMEAVRMEIAGQAGYLATLQATPPAGVLDGLLAIYNIGVAGRPPQGGSGSATAAIGGIATIAAAIISDRRLKRDVRRVATYRGLGVYEYRMAWSAQQQVGLMADEVERIVPDAVTLGADGFKRVNYGRVMEVLR